VSDAHGVTVTEKNALLTNLEQLESERSGLQKEVGILEERVRTQKDQLDALHRQLSSYWIRVTEKQIGVTGLLIALISIVVTVQAKAG